MHKEYNLESVPVTGRGFTVAYESDLGRHQFLPPYFYDWRSGLAEQTEGQGPVRLSIDDVFYRQVQV